MGGAAARLRPPPVTTSRHPPLPLPRRGDSGVGCSDAARDILESGLGPCAGDPLSASRLCVALAELHAGRGEAPAARARGAEALARAAESGEDTPVRRRCAAQGLWWQHVGAVAAGDEGGALTALQEGAPSLAGAFGSTHAGPAAALACGLRAHALLLAGDPEAARDETRAATDAFAASGAPESLPAGRFGDLPAGTASLLGGLSALAGGVGAAGALLAAEARGAAAALGRGPGPAGDAAPSPFALRAARAEAEFGLAQLAGMGRRWGEAEAHLEGALRAAEAAYEGNPAATGLVLAATATCYVHTGRFALAEGLFRRGSELLGVRADNFMLDPPGRVLGGARSRPSAGAFVLARWADMLGMVQGRAHHGERLRELAGELWGGAGAGAGALEGALPRELPPRDAPPPSLARVTEQRVVVAR